VCSLYKYVDKLLLSPEYDVFVSQISYEKHFERKGYDTFAQFSEFSKSKWQVSSVAGSSSSLCFLIYFQ